MIGTNPLRLFILYSPIRLPIKFDVLQPRATALTYGHSLVLAIERLLADLDGNRISGLTGVSNTFTEGQFLLETFHQATSFSRLGWIIGDCSLKLIDVISYD